MGVNLSCVHSDGTQTIRSPPRSGGSFKLDSGRPPVAPSVGTPRLSPSPGGLVETKKQRNKETKKQRNKETKKQRNKVIICTSVATCSLHPPPSLRVLQILRRLASALADLLGLEPRRGINWHINDCPKAQKIHAAKVEF